LPELSLRAIRRLMSMAGADRISKKAVLRVREITEKIIMEITRRALIFMEHAHRRTLREDDIINAFRLMFSALSFV